MQKYARICLLLLMGMMLFHLPVNGNTIVNGKGDRQKMSSFVRRLAISAQQRRRAPALGAWNSKRVCALVEVDSDDASEILTNYGCDVLAQMGNIWAVAIPINQIDNLSTFPAIRRIEAERGRTLLMDSTYRFINAEDAYIGTGLPQAYTGQGVVIGVQDVGFDLLHPTFFDSTLTTYRIQRFWDQLSTDTIGSSLYVGADYTTADAIQQYAHSRDGHISGHGTHTAGIAAGSGYETAYRGIAYESDICLVSNAVSEDLSLIDSADVYKYTYTTDVLGFKYIFDYATSQDKPCVISFSEGSSQDFVGNDQLFYAALDEIMGEGKIIVASAGNYGWKNTYISKPQGIDSKGSFLITAYKSASFTVCGKGNYELRCIAWGDENDTITIASDAITQLEDSVYIDTISAQGRQYMYDVVAYPSCYDSDALVMDVYVRSTEDYFGQQVPYSVEIVGSDAEVELYQTAGLLLSNEIQPSLNDAEPYASILSPGSANNVICVGATGYRTQYTNARDSVIQNNQATNGYRAAFSSIGPTYDKRIKPDVMAPGMNIISSFSHVYAENNPTDDADIITYSNVNGVKYPWLAESGTSMSTPVIAGAIALWLQANPKLTPQDVLGVIERTSTQPDSSLTYPNNYYGYGQIDVYRGLLDVLDLSSIEGLSQSQPTGVSFSVSGENLNITLSQSTTKPIAVRFYTTAGQLVKNLQLPTGKTSYSITLADLPHGVLAIQVSGATHATTGSTLIRH